MSVSQTPILNYIPLSGGMPPTAPVEGANSSNVIPIIIYQPGHGFIAGNVLRFNGTSYVMAQANTAANSEVVGIVTEVISGDRFMMATPGGRLNDVFSGLSPGSVYFLSSTAAGALTAAEPSTPGEISKPLLIADTDDSGYFFNFRGMTVPAPITSMTLDPLMIGTDFRLVALAGGGKLEVRNPGTGLWATADQWTNP